MTTMTKPIHKPVLLKEVTDALRVAPGKRYIDCTLGLGGHALNILEKSMPNGQVIGIDADPDALRIAKSNLIHYSDSVTLVNDNFSNLDSICCETGFTPVDGILFDLGVSSLQLDTGNRGFSFQQDAELDMRFSPDQVLTATDLVNILPEHNLADLLRQYGEEPASKIIARRIIENRPIINTIRLAQVIEEAVGGRHGKLHPATRTFQALRIMVNHELENLEGSLHQTLKHLAVGGRLVVISYHSLEDRIVKEFMRKESTDCICPPEIPVCRCGHKATLKIITKKVVVPSVAEVESNPRSRSAKMRVAERI